MRISSLVVFGLTLALTLPVTQVAPAQVTQKGGKYTLRYLWKKGSSASYGLSFVTVLPGSEQPQIQTMGLKLDVLDVKAGVATIHPTLKGSTNAIGKVEDLTVDATGRTKSNGATANLIPVLPTKAVGVGETWSSTEDLKVANTKTPGKIQTTATFVGVKTKDTKQVAEVSFVSTITGGKLNGQANGTIDFELDDGLMTSMVQNLTIEVEQKTKGVQKIPIKLTFIKE